MDSVGATNWLPDRGLLITGQELIRAEPDGSRVRHADLSHISSFGWSEITVDGRGNVYVNTINFDFAEFNDVLTSGEAPGKIALVTPDGEAREVANGLAFPNGMVITPGNETLVVAESFAARLTAFDIAADGSLSNRRVWADGVGPDGICLDADGCIWASSANMANDCARIREGGEGHCCIEPECAGEAQQSGGSPSWKGAEKGSNHSTVPMICRLWAAKWRQSHGVIAQCNSAPERPGVGAGRRGRPGRCRCSRCQRRRRRTRSTGSETGHRR
jgi:hypothetical protein